MSADYKPQVLELNTVPASEQTVKPKPSITREVLKFFRDLPGLILFALIFAWLIKSFLVHPFVIPSGSMEPTLISGDYILVNRLQYRFSDPARRDIVVFKFPLDPKKDYVKRIIGLPGDKVEIRGGILRINEKIIKEPYLKDNNNSDYGPVVLPKSKYLVLGDNRSISSDSRVWGYLPRENILGKAFLIYWPPQRISSPQ